MEADKLMEYQEFLEKLGSRFKEALTGNKHKGYTYTFKSWEVSIFHGLVALASDHPEIGKLSPATHQVISDFRAWCKTVWVDMGMTQQEADLLDRLREE